MEYSLIYTYSVCFYFISSDPPDEEDYVFDTTLLQNYCSPKVDPSKMSINNLTHDELVADLSEFEERLKKFTNEKLEKVY